MKVFSMVSIWILKVKVKTKYKVGGIYFYLVRHITCYFHGYLLILVITMFNEYFRHPGILCNVFVTGECSDILYIYIYIYKRNAKI